MDYYRRNELPETVRRYHQYTHQFQDWLIEIATQRNIEIADVATKQASKGNHKNVYKLHIDEQEVIVSALAATGAPLMDTSGINDLNDAIRMRKEVTQYHKYNKTADKGHGFIDGNLKGLLAALRNMVTPARRPRDRKDAKQTHVVVSLPSPNSIQDEQEALLKKAEEQDIPENTIIQQYQKPRPPKKKPEAQPLTEEEEQLQRESLILCFLYAFNRIRDVIREVWLLYHNGLINIITAALVTDLAQSRTHLDISALVEDLETSPGQLSVLIRELFEKIMDSPETTGQLSEEALRHLFCMDATPLVSAYITTKPPAVDSSGKQQPEHPLMLFLRFLDVIRQSELKLPIWDHFTQEILLHQTSSQDWLPLGFHILLDVKEVLREDNYRVLKDLTEHGFDIARLIRYHIEYEDHMWAVGTKPDYFRVEEIKFSTIYLKTLEGLLDWLQDLFRAQDATEQEPGMTASVFVTVHSTLAGLVMWHYDRYYHQTSITKIQWFINGIAHLYNAARQIGGLDLAWPDLDFIIATQGPGRIFLGGPPIDPNDFLNCYLLSSFVSLVAMASDFATHHTGNHLPRGSQSVRVRRGLMSETPLERLIFDFYESDLKKDRWVERHAIFKHLYDQKEASGSTDESGEVSQKLKDLRAAFSAFVTNISPPKPRRKGKNKEKVKKPDFAKQNETYPGLFETMREELQSEELHSNFDHLSFYRRAYDLVLRIREEVLFTNEVQVYRSAEVEQDQTPSYHQLLADLFRALQIQPKTKRERKAEAEGPGQELSTQVVPLKQLKGVADLMAALIREKGSIELERTKLRHVRKWDDLKASYEAEKESAPTPAPTPAPTSAPAPVPTSIPDDTDDMEEALIHEALSKATGEKYAGKRLWFFATPDVEAEPNAQVDETSSPCPPEPELSVKHDSSAQPSTTLDNYSKTDDPKPDEDQVTLNEDSTQDAPVAEPQAGVGDDKTTTLPTGRGIRIYLGKQVRGVDDDGAPDKKTKRSRTWKDAPDDPKLLFGAYTLRLGAEQAVANKGSWLDKAESSVPKILDSLTKLTSEKAVVFPFGDDEVRTAGPEAQILQPVDSAPHQSSHFDASDVDWVELAVQLADKQYHIVKTPTTEAPKLSQDRRLLEDVTGKPLKLVSNNVFRSLHPALFEAVKSIGQNKSIHDSKRTKEKKPTQKVKSEEEFKPSSLTVKLRVPPTKLNELLMNLRVSEELAKLVEPTTAKPARERSMINRFLDDTSGKPLKVVRNNIFASLIQQALSEDVEPDESVTPVDEVEATEQIKAIEEVKPVGETNPTEEVDVGEKEGPIEDIKTVDRDRNNIYRDMYFTADDLEFIEQDKIEKTGPTAEEKLDQDVKLVEEDKPTGVTTSIEETTPKPKKHTRLPNGIFHTLTYSSTTSRKSTTTTKSSNFSKLLIEPRLTNLLTRSRPKRGLFHRLTGHKHRIAFRCHTQCAMARALNGNKSRLQRQMDIAVAALKQSSRRDSAELERVWRWAGEEEAGRVEGESEWETESNGGLD